MADSNSSADTTWKKKRAHSSKILAAREAQNRTVTSEKSAETSSINLSANNSSYHHDHNYDLSLRPDSPMLEIEGDSFTTMFDSPVKKRSNVIHSTPMIAAPRLSQEFVSQTSKLKETIKHLEEDLLAKSEELAETKAKLLISESRVFDLEKENSEFKILIKTLKHDVINLETRVSSKLIADHLLYTEKACEDQPKVIFKEKGKLAIIRSNSAMDEFFFATMDPTTSYASLTHQRDKKRRLDILTDFVNHLAKGDATRDVGDCLGDFLLRNPSIAQHVLQYFRDETRFHLSASDSLDFKLALGLSWKNYRKIKCFMSKYGHDFLAPTNKAIDETSNRKVKSKLNFSFLNLTEKDEKIEKPLLIVSNLSDFIEECWLETVKSGELTDDDPRFNNEIWITIGGDNGGKTTKLTLSFMNVVKPNSVHNTRLIGFYEGADKADNLRAAFSHLADQIQHVQESLTLPYPLPNGLTEQKKIKMFLVGDTMFLSYFNGHQGPASSFPCLFCMIKLSDLKKTGTCKLSALNHIYKTRNIFPKKLENSQTQYPLFSIQLKNIVPPVLHIPLGLFNDIFKQIRIMCKKIDLAIEFTVKLDSEMLEKEMTVQAMSTAILDRIDCLSREITCLEEDIDVYCRLRSMITTCIKNEVKPLRKSSLCSSVFCFSSAPFFKQYCDNWLDCKKCTNMTHTVCALVLTKHQMSKANGEYFECFACRDANKSQDILQMCAEKEDNLKQQLATLKTCRDENSAKADKLDRNLDKFKGDCEKKLFSALDALGVDLKAYHSGSFVGNHVFRMLKINKEINAPDLLTRCLESKGEYRKKFYDALVLLGKIFAITTKVGFLNNIEITELERYCCELKKMMAEKFADWTTTVKLHMFTNHVPDFAKTHLSCGSFSEQGIESLHAQMNHIRRLFVMRGAGRFMPLIFQHHHLLATVKDGHRFLPKKRILRKSLPESSNCEKEITNDRLSDDEFEVEF